MLLPLLSSAGPIGTLITHAVSLVTFGQWRRPATSIFLSILSSDPSLLDTTKYVKGHVAAFSDSDRSLAVEPGLSRLHGQDISLEQNIKLTSMGGGIFASVQAKLDLEPNLQKRLG